MGEDSPPVEASAWTVVWAHVMKLGSASIRQKHFCLMCSFRVELTHWLLYQWGDSETRETEASMCLALSHLSRIQCPPPQVGFVTTDFPVCCLPPPFLATTWLCLMQYFHKSLPLSVYWMCLRRNWFVESVCGGAFGSAPFFKMSFNRDDCLTLGSRIKYLWVVNCFSLIRTWGTFSCHVTGFKTFGLLERFQP